MQEIRLISWIGFKALKSVWDELECSHNPSRKPSFHTWFVSNKADEIISSLLRPVLVKLLVLVARQLLTIAMLMNVSIVLCMRRRSTRHRVGSVQCKYA